MVSSSQNRKNAKIPSADFATSLVKPFDLVYAESPAKLGRLILASMHEQSAGCVALHALDSVHCEMKRLYVRPQFRGHGLGKILAQRVIADARQIGYTRLRLDTVEPKMKAAVAMYRQVGFREIAPYRTNPLEGALYMELEL